MAWTSTVPAAVANLVAALRAASGLAGVPVKDGPTVSGETLTEVVVVGFAADEIAASVEGAFAYEGMVISPNRETYTVTCAASVLRGGGDMTAARTRAYELLAAAGAAISGDKTLGGAVMSARLADTTLTQIQNSKGAVATVTFDVAVDAFTGR